MGRRGELVIGSVFFNSLWKPKAYFWVLSFVPIQSSPSLEIQSAPSPIAQPGVQ